jgi:hypothetical protein
MALKISGETSDYEPLPAGEHVATCYRVVDFGTREEQWQDNPPKKRTTLHITWEVPGVKLDDGRPYTIGKTYTTSLNENSALYKDLVTWRGKPFSPAELESFDVSKLVGMPVNLHIEQTTIDNVVRSRIKGVFKPEKFEQTATENEQQIFDLDDYCKEFNGNSSAATKAMCDVFDSLPTWQQTKIEESFQLQAAKQKGGATEVKEEASQKGLADLANDDKGESDEDVPF